MFPVFGLQGFYCKRQTWKYRGLANLGAAHLYLHPAAVGGVARSLQLAAEIFEDLAARLDLGAQQLV